MHERLLRWFAALALVACPAAAGAQDTARAMDSSLNPCSDLVGKPDTWVGKSVTLLGTAKSVTHRIDKNSATLDPVTGRLKIDAAGMKVTSRSFVCAGPDAGGPTGAPLQFLTDEATTTGVGSPVWPVPGTTWEGTWKVTGRVARLQKVETKDAKGKTVTRKAPYLINVTIEAVPAAAK